MTRSTVPPRAPAGPAVSPRPAAQDLIDEIVAELRVAFGELRCVGSERLVKQGVSMTHLHILSMLEHHGDLTMSHLADLLGVSYSNATGVIDRVEERGLVERVRDTVDRRVVIVRLTDQGRDRLGDVQLLKEDLLQKVLARLDPDALRGVGEALRNLRAAALAVAGDPEVAAHWHAHGHPAHSSRDKSERERTR